MDDGIVWWTSKSRRILWWSIMDDGVCNGWTLISHSYPCIPLCHNSREWVEMPHRKPRLIESHASSDATPHRTPPLIGRHPSSDVTPHRTPPLPHRMPPLIGCHPSSDATPPSSDATPHRMPPLIGCHLWSDATPHRIPPLIIVFGALLSIDAVEAFFLVGSTAKHFHSRSVSSAAADTTVLPSGDIAMCSTRAVCPTNGTTE